jgi:hypothetical protein
MPGCSDGKRTRQKIAASDAPSVRAASSDLEFVLAELIEHQKRLIFPGDQHIALAPLRKDNRRPTSSGVEDRNIAVECRNEVARLRLVATRLAQGVTPGCEVVPARAAQRLRVGRDDLDIGTSEVWPIADLLWITFAHQEDDSRGVGRAVVW